MPRGDSEASHGEVSERSEELTWSEAELPSHYVVKTESQHSKTVNIRSTPKVKPEIGQIRRDHDEHLEAHPELGKSF